MYHIFLCCKKKMQKRVTAPILKPTDDQKPETFLGGHLKIVKVLQRVLQEGCQSMKGSKGGLKSCTITLKILNISANYLVCIAYIRSQRHQSWSWRMAHRSSNQGNHSNTRPQPIHCKLIRFTDLTDFHVSSLQLELSHRVVQSKLEASQWCVHTSRGSTRDSAVSPHK